MNDDEQVATDSAQFHAGVVMGAMSTHGCSFEEAVGTGPKVTLIGETRNGHPLEITVEVRA